MRSARKPWRAATLAVLTLFGTAGRPWALTLEEVARDLICLCGCGKVLSVCEMEGWAVPAKALIVEMIGQGKDKDAIVAYFVEQYGEKVLAAPTKRGFNLTAWILPFFAIVAGGAGILAMLRRWKRASTGEGTEESAPPTARSDEMEEKAFAERLEREMAESD
ncbi:MAG: cytochrome c-type biogenesis protein CcmH [Candidatus Tectomicrobia bacterium]|nr:cytochrome c-type biogenesis protein CcmH [Candidatus Tectomicrobia bacterium]